MKILHTVEFYYPSIGGTQEVIRHLSERMVKKGHDVYVATTKLPERKSLEHNGVKIVEFDVSGNEVRGYKGKDIEKYKKFLQQEDFDIILNYASQQWTTDLFSRVIDKVKAKKVLVPCGFSALYEPTYKKFFEDLPAVLRKYDKLVFLSNDYRDINFAREHGLDNYTVIPNAACENEFCDLATESEKNHIKARFGLGGLVITTIGNHTNEKGHAELMRCFKALPISPATLVIAGTIKPHDGCYDMCEMGANSCNNKRRFIGKRIVLVDGSDRDSVTQILKASDIFAFFSNIECSPLVIFESAAAGVPFISSGAGNNSEIVDWTKGGIIVKSKSRYRGRTHIDKKDALKKLTLLAINKKLRLRLGAAGHQS